MTFQILCLTTAALGATLLSGCANEAFSPAAADDAGDAAASPADGSTSSGPDSSASAFCTSLSPAPAFCADFDESNILTSYVYGQQTSSLVRDTDPDAGADISLEATGTSPPNAFVSVTPAITSGGGELRARLHQKQSIAKTHFHVAFDFRLDAYENTGVRLFELHGDGPGLVVQWDIVSGGGNLHGNSSAGASMYAAPTLMPPAGTTWNHAEIDVALTQTTATMSLVLNRNTAGTVSAMTSIGNQPCITNFDIGLLSGNPSSAARVSYDNFVYDEN